MTPAERKREQRRIRDRRHKASKKAGIRVYHLRLREDRIEALLEAAGRLSLHRDPDDQAAIEAALESLINDMHPATLVD